MQEVRREIDRLDREIVALIAERLDYIRQAARIKQDRQTVRDEARIEDVVAKVKAAAERAGASEELVELLYRQMIDWCIAHEFEEYDRLRG